MSDKTAADAPSRAHDLIARLRTAASNNRIHADRGTDAAHHLLDAIQIVSKRAIADMHDEAAAALSAKDARISTLETMLGELVRSFNPEPALPPLTQWDRAAAVLGNVPTQSPSEIRGINSDNGRPMSEAPRDGSQYLAWCIETGRQGFDIGRWRGNGPDDVIGFHGTKYGWHPIRWWPLPEPPRVPIGRDADTAALRQEGGR